MKKTIIFLLILILIAVIILIVMTNKKATGPESSILPNQEIQETEEPTAEQPQENTESTALLDIPLTESGVRAALEGWNQNSLESGGSFSSPPEYVVTEHDNGIFEINKPGVTESFIAAGNRAAMQSYYGTAPDACWGGDLETGICLYGDNEEIEHVIKIMTYFE